MTEANRLEFRRGAGRAVEYTDDERRKQIADVVRLLETNDKGVVGSPQNLEVILTRDPWFAQRIRWNEFAEVLEWEGRRLVDEDVTFIRLTIGRTYNKTWSAGATLELVQYVGRLLSYHPVKAFLRRLVWDGVPRIDMLLPRYVGCEDTELSRAIGRRFLISCIARVMKPPCKVDTVLTLYGGQGAGKSTFFKVLCGQEWFRDTPFDIRNKDSYQLMRGAWLYEVAEMASIRQRDVESVKAFFAAEVDHFRPPYGKVVRESVRQCVFVSTTNEPSFLKDPTGARRFWPVKVGDIDLKALEEDREQLWAEALKAFVAHEPWWLTREQDDELSEVHKEYTHEELWEDSINEWVAKNIANVRAHGVRVATIAGEALEIEKGKMAPYDERRITNMLTAQGWTKQRKRSGSGSGRLTFWYPPPQDG